MNKIEYYKSLISDEEVIKALVKESKAREGEPLKEKIRVRPNINFLQRTVTNLVSSNKRIKINKIERKERRITEGKIKTPHNLMREILLTNKVHCESVRNHYVKQKTSKSNLLMQRQGSSSSEVCISEISRNNKSSKVECIEVGDSTSDDSDVVCITDNDSDNRSTKKRKRSRPKNLKTKHKKGPKK